MRTVSKFILLSITFHQNVSTVRYELRMFLLIKTITYLDKESAEPYAHSLPQQPKATTPTNQMAIDYMAQKFDSMDLQFASMRQCKVWISSRMDHLEVFRRGEGHENINQD